MPEQAQEVMQRATTPVPLRGPNGKLRYDEPPTAELIEAFKVLKRSHLAVDKLSKT